MCSSRIEFENLMVTFYQVCDYFYAMEGYQSVNVDTNYCESGGIFEDGPAAPPTPLLSLFHQIVNTSKIHRAQRYHASIKEIKCTDTW